MNWAGCRRPSSTLDAYRRDLELVVGVAKRHSTGLLLATQLSLWRADLPPELEALLHSGEKDPQRAPAGADFYSSAALELGMAAFNAVLLDVCAAHEIPCIDLLSTLPPDTAAFYDDLHFNEAGARLVAEAIAPTVEAVLRGNNVVSAPPISFFLADRLWSARAPEHSSPRASDKLGPVHLRTAQLSG